MRTNRAPRPPTQKYLSAVEAVTWLAFGRRFNARAVTRIRTRLAQRWGVVSVFEMGLLTRCLEALAKGERWEALAKGWESKDGKASARRILKIARALKKQTGKPFPKLATESREDFAQWHDLWLAWGKAERALFEAIAEGRIRAEARKALPFESPLPGTQHQVIPATALIRHLNGPKVHVLWWEDRIGLDVHRINEQTIYDWVKASAEESGPRDWVEVRLRTRDVITLARAVSPKRRGPKERFKWRDFYEEAFRLLGKHGIPDASAKKNWRQSAFEKALATWCTDAWDHEPAESTIRVHAIKAIQQFRSG